MSQLARTQLPKPPTHHTSYHCQHGGYRVFEKKKICPQFFTHFLPQLVVHRFVSEKCINFFFFFYHSSFTIQLIIIKFVNFVIILVFQKMLKSQKLPNFYYDLSLNKSWIIEVWTYYIFSTAAHWVPGKNYIIFCVYHYCVLYCRCCIAVSVHAYTRKLSITFYFMLPLSFPTPTSKAGSTSTTKRVIQLFPAKKRENKTSRKRVW